MTNKKALLVGATGLVGNELLQMLLAANEYDNVITIVRRPIELEHPKLTEVVCSFDKLAELDSEYYNVDDVFCCFGTTIKKAGSQDNMYKIDVEYPTQIAKLAKENGARHFLLVSSMNANAEAKLFYPRIKGQLENNVKSISYERISIFRPSILMGDRKEQRFGEDLAIKIYKCLEFIVRKPMPRIAIKAKDVANGMYKAAQIDRTDRVRIYSAKEIAKL